MEKRSLMIFMIILVIIIIVSFLSILNLDIQELKPPEDILTGGLVYVSAPFSLEQLKQGIQFNGGWNLFIWTEEIKEPININEALKSIEDSYLYIYNYREQKFYFNPTKRLSDRNDFKGYKIFEQIESGRRYAIFMNKKDVLKYEKPEVQEQEEPAELKQEKPELNNAWIWIILIAVIFIIFRRRILSYIKR